MRSYCPWLIRSHQHTHASLSDTDSGCQLCGPVSIINHHEITDVWKAWMCHYDASSESRNAAHDWRDEQNPCCYKQSAMKHNMQTINCIHHRNHAHHGEHRKQKPISCSPNSSTVLQNPRTFGVDDGLLPLTLPANLGLLDKWLFTEGREAALVLAICEFCNFLDVMVSIKSIEALLQER